MKRFPAYISVLTALCALTGCGVELTGGAATGEAETVVVDSPPESGSSSSLSPEPRPSFARMADGNGESTAASSSPAAQAGAIAAGTVTADLSVALLTASGDPLPITDGSVSGSVSLASFDTLRIGLEELRSGSYPRVRVTFTRVEAQLAAPFLNGAGLPLEGKVTVDLSGGPLTLDVPMTVPIPADGRTTIVVDLASSVWLLQANPVGKTVAAGTFGAAVKVRLK